MRGWTAGLAAAVSLVLVAVAFGGDAKGVRGLSENWLAAAGARVTAERFRLTGEGGVFTGDNPSHRFDIEMDDRGVRVTPRRSPDTDWHWTTVAVGREDAPVAVAPAGPSSGTCDEPRVEGYGERCVRRVEYDRGNVVEWYANRPSGVEQGFEIGERPAGSGPLVVTGRVDTALDGRSNDEMDEIEFRDGDAAVLRYRGLVVSDAAGANLDAWMEWRAPDTIRLLADDADAVYPVTIDPALFAATWAVETDEVLARFGSAAAGAGDVNGDGYDDVIIGAYRYENGQVGEGAAFVFLGDEAGLQTSPVWSAESDQEWAYFGETCAGAGDVDGDGYDDVIVGSSWYDNGLNSEGAAFVYHGRSSGVESSPDWMTIGPAKNAHFGIAAAGAGDVNNDGYDDVIVGAWGWTNGQNTEGLAQVFLGSSLGLAATPAWRAEGDQESSRFGIAAAGAGDVNGDGYDDVIIGQPWWTNGENVEGRVVVFLGQASGVQSTPAWKWEPDQEYADVGSAVAGAGDVNGDGYDDVIAGAYSYSGGQNDEGKAFVFLGSSLGPQNTPIWTREGNQAEAFFGFSVAGAGDVNADGYDDVVVGASHYENALNAEGRVDVFLGHTGGLESNPVFSDFGGKALAALGSAVGGAGDVDGDGADDVIAGALGWTNTQNQEGRALVYYGGQDNDACDDAALVRVPAQVRGDTVWASDSFLPWCVSGIPANDTVYLFDALAGFVYTVDLWGDPSFDTVLAVREGDCATGAQVGCVDEYEGEPSHTRLEFTVSDDGPYWVFVDGADNSSGSYTLTITSSTTTPSSSTTTTTMGGGDDDDDDGGDDDGGGDDDTADGGGDDDDDGGCCGC